MDNELSRSGQLLLTSGPELRAQTLLLGHRQRQSSSAQQVQPRSFLEVKWDVALKDVDPGGAQAVASVLSARGERNWPNRPLSTVGSRCTACNTDLVHDVVWI